MKRLLLSLSIAISFIVSGQEAPWIGPTVITVDSAFSKQQVFTSVLHWIPTYFEDAQEVIEFQDPNTGVIMGSGTSPNYFVGMFGEKHPAGWWKFDFKIEVRDGKYRFQIFNVRMEHPSRTLVIGEDTLMGYDKNRADELKASLTEGFSNIPMLLEEAW